MSQDNVIERLDKEVDTFVRRCRTFNEDVSLGRAQMFILQHRQNTRFRNSVLKLRVATNCPVWDVKMGIIEACTEEIVADHKHGGGQPHWEIVENLGIALGLERDAIQNADLLPSTRMAWLAWEALMSNRHWLEGLIANTCAERINVPGYGEGVMRDKGWCGLERGRWGEAFGLADDQLGFFKLHAEADLEHSDLGWNTAARYAADLKMEDAVVEACRVNLMVWESYFNGILDGGDAMRV
jgi:pyrroloquinoline quinone (PQQ) biosynthesis protein C